MAIRGYFEPVRDPLCQLLPPVSIPGGLAGKVLEEQISVDEALVLDWIRGRSESGNRSGQVKGTEVARAGSCVEGHGRD